VGLQGLFALVEEDDGMFLLVEDAEGLVRVVCPNEESETTQSAVISNRIERRSARLPEPDSAD
jgi:hypothetical protein